MKAPRTMAPRFAALGLGLSLLATAPGQNTTIARTITAGQARDVLLNHKGQDLSRDTDGDGLSDTLENQLGTDPADADTDSDGLPDGLEISYGFDPKSNDAGAGIAYTVSMLPSPVGTTFASASDINNSGQVAGWADDYVVRWKNGVPETGLASGAWYSYGQAINSTGIVVGEASRDSYYNYAMKWVPGSPPAHIGAAGTFTYFAWDVNASGDVVGIDQVTGAFNLNGANNAIASLNAPAGYGRPNAYAINDSGVIVGRVYSLANSSPRGVQWVDGIASLLPAGIVRPNSINNRGEIVGNLTLAAFHLKGGNLTILPMPDEGGFLASAVAINNIGEILGDVDGDQVIWRPDGAGGWHKPEFIADGIVAPLNPAKISVYGLNDKGQLAGEYYNTATSSSQAVVLTPILRPNLLVDANRDGVIKLAGEDASDATSAAQPYRFWANDDDDTSARITPTVAAETDTVIVSTPDYQRAQIFSKRNLEDFTRLWISIGGLQDALASGTIQVGLKWKDGFVGAPAINIYSSADATGSESYLKVDTAAQTQITGVFNNAIKDKSNKQTADTNGTFVFTPDFWAEITTANSKKCLLFEGAGVGFGQLVIVLLDQNGNPIGEGPGVWLDLKNIKSMYERAVATTGGSRSENGVDYTIPLPYSYVGPDPSNIPQPTMGWEPNTLGFSFESDPAETKTYIVYVHGWRWSPEKANNRTETVFKRLWHLGYKGRLAALRWPTFYGGPDDGDDWLAGLSTYNDSEYRAWKSGESLKQYVNQLPNGYTRSIVAHSMGNIVTGSALQKGMAVANYALLNGAIPAMCYDESSALHQPWNYTTPNDDSDSGTKSMAYTGQLKTLNTNAVNFFLTRDSATTFAWEINNDRFKPQNQIFIECVRGYTYARANPPGTKLFVDFCVSPLRHLIDEDEAMAFACQSLTKTVGAEGLTAGPISSTVDMDTFSFGDSHGAEWDRNFDQTRTFYIQLMRSLQLPLQP